MLKPFFTPIAYFLLAILLTFPLIFSIDRSVTDPVDPLLNTWIMAWEHHTLLTDPGEFYNTNIFYPYQGTLLYSETLLLPSLLMLPLHLATGNAILTHNLFMLLGFTMTGFSGYLLGRWLFGNHWSGWLLGGVFAFNSYTLSNVGQAQLVHLEWLPLALLYVGKLLQRSQLRNAVFIALFLAAQFYTTIYYGLFGFVVVGLVGGGAWLFQSYPSLAARVRTLLYLCGALLAAIILCLPLVLFYFRLSNQLGFERTLADTWPFSASLEMWLASPTNNLIYGRFFGQELPKLGFYKLDALFPGLLLPILAIAGLVLWTLHATQRAGRPQPSHGLLRASIKWPLLLIGSIAFFFLLSLGPYPQRQSLQPAFEITLPYAWIHEYVPGFQALRAPGRFAVFVFLGLAVAAAYGIARLRSTVLRSALLFLLLVELLALPTNALFTPTIDADRQALYEWLAQQPNSTYLELPIYPFGQEGEEGHWLESQFQSIRHWHKSPLGYSGFFPPHFERVQSFLSAFPQREVTHYLRAAGVEWVILHRQRLPIEKWAAVEAAIAENDWDVRQWGDSWLVNLPPTPVSPPNQSFYLPDVAQMGATMALGIILTSDQPTPVLPNNHLRIEWQKDGQSVLSIERSVQPPPYVHPVAVASIAIPVPEAAGDYTLLVLDPEVETTPLASTVVHVVQEAAPPEVRLLPVQALEAAIICHMGEAQIRLQMRTSGWFEEPFTLSARLLDKNGVDVGRSAADIEFPIEAPRSDFLSINDYLLPLDSVPDTELGELTLRLVAYRWQQEAERIVPRYFVGADGAPMPELRLPLQRAEFCDGE